MTPPEIVMMHPRIRTSGRRSHRTGAFALRSGPDFGQKYWCILTMDVRFAPHHRSFANVQTFFRELCNPNQTELLTLAVRRFVYL